MWYGYFIAVSALVLVKQDLQFFLDIHLRWGSIHREEPTWFIHIHPYSFSTANNKCHQCTRVHWRLIWKCVWADQTPRWSSTERLGWWWTKLFLCGKLRNLLWRPYFIFGAFGHVSGWWSCQARAENQEDLETGSATVKVLYTHHSRGLVQMSKSRIRGHFKS